MSEILDKQVALTVAQVRDLFNTPVVLLDGTDDVGDDKIVDLVTVPHLLQRRYGVCRRRHYPG